MNRYEGLHDSKVRAGNGRFGMVWSLGLLCLAGLLGSASVSAGTLPGPMVDSDWLAKNLDKVLVLDVRKDVKSFEKRAKGEKGPGGSCGAGGKKSKKPMSGNGHVPGAVLAPLKKIFGKEKRDGKTVKLMAPKKKDFEKLMQRSGVNQDSAVVISGKGEQLPHTAYMTRLYWTMKYFGFENVAILDGGTAQWKMDGHKAEYGKSKRPARGNFTASAERREIRATLEEVVALTKGRANAQILDARPEPFYLGLTYNRKVQSPDRKGHIPTARNFPVDLLIDTAGPTATLYDKKDILKAAKLLGIDLMGASTVTSCHTGVKASITWFVLSELLGNKSVRLYDGSMLEWSLVGKPVERPLD
uniref:Thiosulfate/3-mercaptopyruvate sulfurtransferase n=1 Tax=Candidatus Kentrum sp. MB TaxID=2138164 RepID=A0A451B7X4_9GAMM|nr:MAG: thiosulfate/3-mercaptopyruvate sulfurtransferase [Candidatus Kentron sp. MB]VFK27675.1 MAG: thiosulfate/3-mercaptopyruvate sulfurtransferase [Candidatus Kentron sp. MB]VFK74385.1 MAG: thiosulfate/3-mercaptopyruvate sulfurtransferase [Candidatus Kentron sp. MB]